MASIFFKDARFVQSIFPRGARLLSQTHKMYSQSDLTILDMDPKTGIATMSLNNPPVNALGIDLITAMHSDLKEVIKTNAKGLILTSALENIFSAGFDVTQLYTSNKESLTNLMSVTQDVTELLHSFPIPIAALVNGHAFGGGCVFASCCEYRIMMPRYRIGMIEVAVGIVPPHWVRNCILEVLDRRTAEVALTQAKQFPTDEALKVGFIDSIVVDKNEGITKCQEFINSFRGINYVTRSQTKRQLRYKLFEDKNADLKRFVDEILEPQVQEMIGAYIKAMNIKSK